MMMGARVAIEEGNGWRFRSRSMGPWALLTFFSVVARITPQRGREVDSATGFNTLCARTLRKFQHFAAR